MRWASFNTNSNLSQNSQDCKNTIWRMWGRGYTWTTVTVGDWQQAGQLQGQMSCAGVEAYGRRSRWPGWRRDSRHRYSPGTMFLASSSALATTTITLLLPFMPERLLPWRWKPWPGGTDISSGEAGRSKIWAATALGSDNTETTECWAEPDLGPAVAEHRPPQPHWLNSGWTILFKIRK
jgi:hypothetical protein